MKSESCSVVSKSLWPHGLYSPWNSPSQNTGVGSCSLLQGTFPPQGLNSGLLHCRQILYHLSDQGIKRNARQRAILKTRSLNLPTNQYRLQKSSVSTSLELHFRNHLVKMYIRWLGNLSQLTVIVSKKYYLYNTMGSIFEMQKQAWILAYISH